jgi:uroporphyrin-III C-methyltransferase
VTDDESNSPPRRGNRGLWIAVLAIIVLAFAGWRSWETWQSRQAQASARANDVEQRLAAMQERLDTLRGDMRSQTQRLQDAAASNRILRDEVLGLSQRGALLEESVARLSDPTRHGAQALRLDEVEMLLSQAAQRLEIAGDVEGARRAYALAAGALDGIDDYRLLNLKQALVQERAAVDALGAAPQAAVAAQLDGFAAQLARLPRHAADETVHARPAWQRLLAPLVDVRPSRDEAIIAPPQRAALERGDQAGFHAALDRIEAWLPRLWPDSRQLRQGREQLKALRDTPLRPDLPVLGSTLQQLRQLRSAGLQLRAPPVAPATSSPEVEP